MKKKILSGLLIGAFVFGLGAADVAQTQAASLDKAKEAKEKYDKAKDTYDKAKNTKEKFGQMRDSDKSNRPEPPKDENGNPMPPPNDSDKSNRPEPPKDENGNPMPPPNGDNLKK